MTSEKRSSTKTLWRRFYLWAVGVFFVYSSYGSLLSLQSSINVEEGLGTGAVACIYLSGATLSLFFLPLLIRRYGAKTCVWCGELGHFIFLAINLHAKWYTLLPASVLVGFGDVMLWTCMPVMNSYFADVYSVLRGNYNDNHYKAMFQSYFFGVFQMSKTAGNAITYVALYGSHRGDLQGHKNMSSAIAENSTFKYCGSNDCYDSEVIDVMINRYVPIGVWSVRILLICLTLLCVVGIVIHVIFIPGKLAVFGISEEMQECSKDEYEPTTECSLMKGTSYNRKRALESVARHHRIQKGVGCAFVLSSAKATIRKICTLNQLLVIPMHLYAGMTYGFVTSEMTRSYTSCMFGVSWVPVHYLLFGIAASFSSYFVGAVSGKTPRFVFFFAATVLDIGTLVYCQLLPTNNRNQTFVIGAYILFGLTQGVWLPLSQVLQLSISSDQIEIGSAINLSFYFIGIGLPFAWSTSLCVSTKIYLQIGMLILVVLGYVVLEKKKVLRAKTQSDSEMVYGGGAHETLSVKAKCNTTPEEMSTGG